LLADPLELEDVRSVGAGKNGEVIGAPRLRGTAALQASTDHCCDEPMAIAGRFPGGRPLRRRRENGVVIGEPRLRGTAALLWGKKRDGTEAVPT
jgi:hypothetical protein